MNFSTPTYVRDTLRAGDEVERVRGANRVLVNNAFNGFPYIDDSTAKRWKLEVNFNVGEASVLAAHARRQYDQAILGSQNYFKVSIPMAPEEKKSAFGTFITNYINRCMKKSQDYTCAKEYQASSLVAHGIGPQIWRDSDNWCPDYVAIEDFRVATDTKTSFKDLAWLAERHLYTPGELCQKVFGKNSDPGWDKKEVGKILHAYDDTNYAPESYTNWVTLPEKRAEMWKQNLGYFSSDAVPSIALWHFLYVDDSDPKDCNWKLCVIPDWGQGAPKGCPEPVFLYKTDKPFAKDLEHIISVQFGDLSSKAPFMFHSVRSLGFLLMEPCFWSNLSICRELQYLMESFNPWFRVEDPADRARVQKIDLAGQSVLEKGVSLVPNTERHQVNPQTIASVKAQMKQLQSEAAQTYTQSTDTGSQREQTAFETRVKVSSVNAMMTGLLGRFFRKEVHAYREICRRFCLKGTTNKDAIKFQEACKREGIPRMWLNVEHWEIEPEVQIGNGSPVLGMASIQELMGLYPMLTPTAQGELLHEAIEVLTNDPRRAERWQPIGKNPILSQGKQFAGAVFGSLMTGSPAPIPEHLPAADYCEVWLGMMSGVVAQIQRTDNMGTRPQLIGLQTVAGAINQQIERLAQIQSAKAQVKEFSNALGQLMNLIKGFDQRLTEQEQAGQLDQEAQAKIISLQQTTQAKIQASQVSTAQKMAQKEETHQQKIRQKDESFAAKEQQSAIKTASGLEADTAKVGSEIGHQSAKVSAEIAQGNAKTEAEVANKKKMAEASEKKTPAND